MLKQLLKYEFKATKRLYFGLYLALALCCGVIIMLGELALGRKTGHGAVGAYQSISKRFKWLGWLSNP